ncbi:MAG: zinc-ribbon domain-containing protein [Christensenellaceae bacterium]
MKTCLHCGALLNDDAKFCANCGAGVQQPQNAQNDYQQVAANDFQATQNAQYQQPNALNVAPPQKGNNPVFSILALVFSILTGFLFIPGIATGFIFIFVAVTAILAITFAIISLCKDTKRSYKIMSIIAIVVTIVLPIIEFIVLFIIGIAIIMAFPDQFPIQDPVNSVLSLIASFR